MESLRLISILCSNFLTPHSAFCLSIEILFLGVPQLWIGVVAAFQMPAAVAAFVVTFEEQKDKGSASWVAHNQECDDLDSELVHDHETLQQVFQAAQCDVTH